MANAEKVLTDLHDSKEMSALWENYRSKFRYAADISWGKVLLSVRQAAKFAGLQVETPSVFESDQEPSPEEEGALPR